MKNVIKAGYPSVIHITQVSQGPGKRVHTELGGRCKHMGTQKTMSQIGDRADKKLFDNIICRGERHLLYPLSPSQRSHHYSMRKLPHNSQLPTRSSALCDSKFVTRMLFKDINCSVQTSANGTQQ